MYNDVKTFIEACDQKPGPSNIYLYKDLIIEEYREFLEGYNCENDTEQLDACFDMMWVIIGYMKSRGWDCESSWDEGAKSNLSKIDSKTGMVIRREDGKIMKPEGWKPPNFAKFVK